ncbi:hypothetical protein SDRG_06455 [Saprolegnia diclina VS20]|uniref:Uncharacterized protein n=1 Tax=Saprolegnia diclina (strain VS20) TaxID=1156394 RepID=T0QR13_SAPDV|nr:hypothetical protein SDRG_06455 [Saprolegnia diclina VS20]EQC36350.1 hypothetical protein SDRG_06455 [Saprolegnia diclina VS20]|eukprot:XP_008610456.1 hypothetical protein SDRG_06455 [Saprolegnia diclina VS20]
MFRLLLDALGLYAAWHPSSGDSSDIDTLTYDAPAPPPPFPNDVAATFLETFDGSDVPDSTGAWFYHYHAASGDKNWRVEHDAPQADPFCQCAQPNSTDACTLYYTKESLYVHFPSQVGACCRLCDATTPGCGMLSPTWLSASPALRYTGFDELDGRLCYQFCPPPTGTVTDCMSYDDYGLPCRFTETTATTVHNLTFTSWTVTTQPPSTFALPALSCDTNCASLFPTCAA